MYPTQKLADFNIQNGSKISCTNKGGLVHILDAETFQALEYRHLPNYINFQTDNMYKFHKH